MHDLKLKISTPGSNAISENGSIFAQDLHRNRVETAESRSKDLEELVYLISHNLKTPLVSVEGFTNLLLEEDHANLSAEQLHYVQRIRDNVRDMNHVINDLLDFARFGKKEYEELPVNLNRVVQQVACRLALDNFFAPEHLSISQTLPIVIGDREGLETLFENLLSNAIKYRQRTPSDRLEVFWEELPRFFAIHVRDNGIGINPEEHSRVFKLFHRGSNVGDIDGSGVGLAICQKIVHQHGGFIFLHSVPGEGTLVSFTLPKREKEQVNR